MLANIIIIAILVSLVTLAPVPAAVAAAAALHTAAAIRPKFRRDSN